MDQIHKKDGTLESKKKTKGKLPSNSKYFSLGAKFQLQQAIFIFWTKFAPKKILPVKNRKNEHHH